MRYKPVGETPGKLIACIDLTASTRPDCGERANQWRTDNNPSLPSPNSRMRSCGVEAARSALSSRECRSGGGISARDATGTSFSNQQREREPRSGKDAGRHFQAFALNLHTMCAHYSPTIAVSALPHLQHHLEQHHLPPPTALPSPVHHISSPQATLHFGPAAPQSSAQNLTPLHAREPSSAFREGHSTPVVG
jgi:hypothetical protein